MTKKIVLVLIILLIIILYFATGLREYLTLSYLKESRDHLLDLYAQNPFRFTLYYCGIYFISISLSFPGAALLSLAAGAFFGLGTGIIVVSFMSALSATAACFLSRYIFRDFIRNRFPGAIEKINRGIENEGGYYLFTIRLIPLFPFFITNMAMGLTKMPLLKFYAISQIGMLPATIVFVNAGRELGRIDTLSGIFSPGLVVSLALIGLAPLLLKKIYGLIKKNKK